MNDKLYEKMNEKEKKQYERLRDKMLDAQTPDKIDYYGEKILSLFEQVNDRLEKEESGQ